MGFWTKRAGTSPFRTERAVVISTHRHMVTMVIPILSHCTPVTAVSYSLRLEVDIEKQQGPSRHSVFFAFSDHDVVYSSANIMRKKSKNAANEAIFGLSNSVESIAPKQE